MTTPTCRSSVTPTLVLCLGDFGERVAQALIPEIGAAGQAVQAAVSWLRVTWPEDGGICLNDGLTQMHLETDEGNSEVLTEIYYRVEEALRNLGSHATHEQLMRAGFGLSQDSATGRQPRCYLVAALQETTVTAILTPLLTCISQLLTPPHGPQLITGFLNIATYRLDPNAPQRSAVAEGLCILSDLVAGQSKPHLWPCIIFDWVKSDGIYATGDDELSAALVILLRVLLLADEPAALIWEALPKIPVSGGTSSATEASAVYCSFGTAVIQIPPHRVVVNWLASRLMAEFLIRRCLDPLEGSQEVTPDNQQLVVNHLQLIMLLEKLAEDLEAVVTTEPRLTVSLANAASDQPPGIAERLILKAGQLLKERVNRNELKLTAQLLSKSGPNGQLPQALARELGRGPHGLSKAEVLLEDIAGQIRSGQAVLAQKLARWPLDYERLIGQISLSLATRNVTQQAIPGPNRLIFNTGIVALSWGYLFGTWAGRLWGAGELAGAVLSILAVVVAVGFWYLFVGRRRLKRAERDYLAAVATLQSAQVETTWLEAAQTVLAAAEAWRKDEAKKLSAARKSLKNVQNALAARPLQLDSTPVTIETLPYLDGYREWLRGVLQEDPLMLQTQAVLETKQILANWPDLEEKVMLKMFIKAGRLALMEVPEMPIERVLIAQDQEELHSHLKRLHQLATPLINLDPVPYPDQTGGPSTFDLVCLEHGAIRRFQRRLGNHWFGSASVVGTDDPRRLTYIRLVPGFDPGNLSEDWFR